MNAHERILVLAAASMDFDLTQGEQRILAVHLSTCPSCVRRASALRADAQSIRALPLRPLPAARSAAILSRVLRGPSQPHGLRLALVAAILVLVSVAVAIVGSQLWNRLQTPVLPTASLSTPTSPPLPSIRPTPPGTPPATPPVTPPVTPPAFQVEAITVEGLGTIRAMAATAGRIVAVGEPGCTVGSDTGPRCWASIWTSPDGSAWTAVAESDALEIGDVALSGESAGIVDVAASTAGFVGVGYAADPGCTGGGCSPVATVWTSATGTDWTADIGALGQDARPHAVTAFRSEWVVVGERFLEDGPRAAVWTSADGAAWASVPDGPAFDIGNYFDTGQYVASGGFKDVVAGQDLLVAAGIRCNAGGAECQVAVWTSPDARAWTIQAGVSGPVGLRTVAVGDAGFVALGSVCDDANCAAGQAGGFRSQDGATWEQVRLDLPFENWGVAESIGGTRFVAVVETESGSTVRLYSSGDGRVWTPVEGPLEIEGAVVIRDTAAVLLPNGLLIVGWAELDRAPWTSTFAFRIPPPS